MRHDLKIRPEYFNPVRNGLKTFEIRKNDRGFEPGDTVILREYSGSKYTGRAVIANIDYVSDFAQQDGFVVFSLHNVRDAEGADQCRN